SGDRDKTEVEAATATDAIADAAGAVGRGATLGTLVQIIKPWRRRFGIVVTSGIARVAAFIGVGIFGALAVAAVKTGSPFGYLLILLALAAPLAGLLHWLESWLAHDIAYRLLAEMRIDLFRKLDTLAPAYLVRRRSGDLIALANQDVETIEYFFAHTVAPALVAVMVPTAVVLTLAFVAWPIALALLPFILYAGLAPVMTRTRIDHLGAQARDALGLLSAYVTETIQGLSDLVAFQAVAGRRRWPAASAGPGRRLGDPLRACRLHLSGRPPAGAERSRTRGSGRRDNGGGRPVGRWQDNHRQFIAAVLGPGHRPDTARRGRSARFRAGPPAGAHLARLAGHLPVQRHLARQCRAR